MRPTWVTPLAANPPAMYAVRVELPSGDVHYEADHPESAYVAEILQELAKREKGLCQLQLVLEDWPLVPSCALRSLAPPGDLVLKLWRDPFQLERATGAHGPGVRELNFGLCGAQPASKSRLLSRYCADADSFASGDLEYVTANFMLNGNPLKLHLWDQPAQYSEMLQAFLKGKDAFLFILDLTDSRSVDHLQLWLPVVLDSEVPVAMVGDQADGSRQVSEEEAQALAKEHCLDYYEASATRDGFSEAVHFLLWDALRLRKPPPSPAERRLVQRADASRNAPAAACALQ